MKVIFSRFATDCRKILNDFAEIKYYQKACLQIRQRRTYKINEKTKKTIKIIKLQILKGVEKLHYSDICKFNKTLTFYYSSVIDLFDSTHKIEDIHITSILFSIELYSIFYIYIYIFIRSVHE